MSEEKDHLKHMHCGTLNSDDHIMRIKQDLDLYGVAYEQLIDGKKVRIDPTTMRVIKPNESFSGIKIIENNNIPPGLVIIKDTDNPPQYISNNPYRCDNPDL